MQDVATTRSEARQPGTGLRRRSLTGWVLAAWFLAAIAGGTLAWAAPRASQTKLLDVKISSLRGALSTARELTTGAEGRLADLQAELDALGNTQEKLVDTIGNDDRAIASLRRRIRKLRSEIADARAASIPASSSTAPISPPDVHFCTPWVDPYTGKTGCT